jgi:hypothetical protein
MSKQYDISIITNEYEAIYLSVSKRKKWLDAESNREKNFSV